MDKINKGHEHFVKQEYSQVTSAYLILLTLNKKNREEKWHVFSPRKLPNIIKIRKSLC